MSEQNLLDSDTSTVNKLASLADNDTESTDQLDDNGGAAGDLLADDKPADESDEQEEVSGDSETDGTGENSEDEIELSDEDLDPNDIELQTPVKMKEVLKKYPDLKKDFPELIAANFREKEYAELLPTVEDAKLAVERSTTLAKFEEVLIEKGEVDKVLSVVKEQNPGSFDRIVNNYMQTLQQVDPQAHNFVVNSTISRYLNIAYARSANNPDLQTAIQMIYQATFPGAAPATNYGKPVSEEESAAIKAARETQAKAETSMLEFHKTQVDRLVGNTIKHTINNNIDPKGVMTPYIKRKAVEDCYNLVEKAIKGDKKFNSIITGIWGKAQKENFAKTELDRIISASKGRAKSVLKEAIVATRTEVLKGISQKKVESGQTKFKVQDTAPARKTTASSTKADNRGKTTFQRLSEP